MENTHAYNQPPHHTIAYDFFAEGGHHSFPAASLPAWNRRKPDKFGFFWAFFAVNIGHVDLQIVVAEQFEGLGEAAYVALLHVVAVWLARPLFCLGAVILLLFFLIH